jgi:hypothetical protein
MAKAKRIRHSDNFGGTRPGAGRPKGAKNKATIERELNVAAVIDRARKEGRELAVDVLERAMKTAEGATAMTKPVTEREKFEAAAKGIALQDNRDGSWELFGQWFDRWTYCADKLSKFQSPVIKAVEAPAPPPDPKQIEAGSRRKFGLRVFEGGKPPQSEAA